MWPLRIPSPSRRHGCRSNSLSGAARRDAPAKGYGALLVFRVPAERGLVLRQLVLLRHLTDIDREVGELCGRTRFLIELLHHEAPPGLLTAGMLAGDVVQLAFEPSGQQEVVLWMVSPPPLSVLPE